MTFNERINEDASTSADEIPERAENQRQENGNWQQIGDLARRIAEKVQQK
jgi:hypothetical protein